MVEGYRRRSEKSNKINLDEYSGGTPGSPGLFRRCRAFPLKQSCAARLIGGGGSLRRTGLRLADLLGKYREKLAS